MSRNVAFELFGEMRHSTPKEQQLYRDMLNRLSVPIKEGESIFNMNEIEINYCDICHKNTQVNRKYYHYHINCDCCGGDHFEIVRYCKDCTPKPPKYITVNIEPYDR